MTNQSSRRHFLKLASSLGCLGVGAPLGLNLAAMRVASAAQLPGDYKALVCVFLYGGNDPYNTVIARDVPSHDRYVAARAHLAVPLDRLAATALDPLNDWDENKQYALHPELGALKPLFDEGQLALALNVGTLVQPVTLTDYYAGRNLPPKLMSHNDQFSIWQTSLVEGANSGWGGRMGDLFASANAGNGLLTNISVGSSATFSSGLRSQEFAIGPQGPVNVSSEFIAPHGNRVSNTIRMIMNRRRMHAMDSELSTRYATVIRGNTQLQDALSVSPPVTMPQTRLGAQLGMVARIINAHQQLGMQRNVFFVGMGGFDSHGSLGTDHPVLLRELGDALAGFQRVMNAEGLEHNVTTFTASDFGRSLTTNGRGSDHGWGGHHFIMGGAVNGRRWVGQTPSLMLGASDDIGQGRLLPAIAVDQYCATLARWMGVTDSEMSTVLPGIRNFDDTNLGFMT